MGSTENKSQEFFTESHSFQGSSFKRKGLKGERAVESHSYVLNFIQERSLAAMQAQTQKLDQE